ncbi:putative pentatricopeptide repeat-containing protein At3g11460, mitochondrial [Curcuma longa]|uniref:putative pentatricopeptide repeat-containing protein At3g11460, mitochondrial n=1 Tax=Curcuma longa TaxID=136217 RepID=UPI003D9FA8C6
MAHRQEFLSLKQGERSVMEYNSEFKKLSEFYPQLVAQDEDWMCQFMQNLAAYIRDRMSGSSISSYREALDRVLTIELTWQQISREKEKEVGKQNLALLRHTLLWYPQLPIPIASLLPSALLAAAALSLPAAAFHLHAISLKSGLLPADAYVLTTVVTAYSRLRLLPLACRLLDELPAAEVATSAFNALISGHALASSPSPSPAALATFRRMRLADVPFDDVTFLALLPAAPPASIPPLHGVAFRSSLASAPSVSNCLLSCFSRIGAVDVARQLFDEMPDQRKDLVSWNAMISCYAQNGLAHQVLALYDKMKESPSVEPDAITLIGVLSSCANLGAYSIGRRIENSINQKDSYASNTHIKNALINLHAKCGDLAQARKVFDEMHQRTIVSWTAMIAGYGTHGHGDEALFLFDKMLEEGIKPDEVVMVSVLPFKIPGECAVKESLESLFPDEVQPIVLAKESSVISALS